MTQATNRTGNGRQQGHREQDGYEWQVKLHIAADVDLKRLCDEGTERVDYACTALEVQQHFKACGTVNRVTILTNQFGQPKGCAYVEFLETDSIHNALLLNESVLHGRRLKVSAKRTNLPGINQYQGRRPFGIRYRRPSLHPPPGFG
ncbi:RNA-binding domain superfamily, partial [Sesbania bispinosa]